jgi:hypothetical protein
MSFGPEREAKPTPPEIVDTAPEEMPEAIEKGGVKVVKSQFTKQVTDDSGQPLITTPATRKVTITLPGDDAQLSQQAKGSTDDAGTWFAKFWLRLIKKAIHFGWVIVGGKNT